MRDFFAKKKGVAQVIPSTKTLGSVETINSQSITVLEKDSAGNVLRCTGTVAITAGWSGYAKWCSYIKTNVSTGITWTYENIGTTTSCSFVLLGSKIVKTTAITSAQILAMFTTPIALTPTPAAGSYIVVDRITASEVYNSAAYATNTTIEFRYTNGSGAKVTADIASLLTATANKIQSVGGIESETTLTSAAPVVACIATGNPVTGDSPINVTIEYRVLSI